MSTNLYLIRHGEAFSNVESTIAGMQTDRGLTPRGLKQAEALRQRLATGEIQADVLYASTMPRARQTAEIIAPALGLPINWDDELHELRPGDADGWTFEQLAAQPDFRRFVNESFVPIAPQGESWAGFQHRVSATLEQITHRHPNQTIVVVAHGGVIEIACMLFIGLAPMARQRVNFTSYNTALTHWRYSQTFSGRHEWQLLGHNDHRHLHGMER